MSENSAAIISKVWGMCGPLRDDGVSYGDYLEQLTYLIFLKMSDEYSRPPYKRNTGIPEGYGWNDMSLLKGAELEDKYREILEKLGEQGGILGKIFKGATNKISNAAILSRIVAMIDKEKWVPCPLMSKVRSMRDFSRKTLRISKAVQDSTSLPARLSKQWSDVFAPSL